MLISRSIAGVCASFLFIASSDAGVIDLTIRAMIDGRDRLELQGTNARWHHIDYAAVGRHEGRNEPTYFSMDLNGYRVMDSVAWTPSWSAEAPNEIRQEEWSSMFSGLGVSLPWEAQSLSLTTIQVRSTASIIQLPSADNRYTTLIEFDDNAPGGHDWYEVRLTYSFASVPAPATLALLPFALLSRRRREDR